MLDKKELAFGFPCSIINIKYDEDSKFVVLFVSTKSHIHYSEKLRASIEKFNLPYISLLIPTIHCSVSPKGSPDIDYCKANMIKKVGDSISKPIVYIDSDCVIESYPYLFDFLAEENYDFAIYNWLNLGDNQAFNTAKEIHSNSQLYTFSHSIDYISSTQLICSGAVQFWGNTRKAKKLLEKWKVAVNNIDQCADDQALDFVYNNSDEIDYIKSYWLPKSYARYAWWVFDSPVINHPDYPNPGLGFVSLLNYEGMHRVNTDKIQPRIYNDRQLKMRTAQFKLDADGFENYDI